MRSCLFFCASERPPAKGLTEVLENADSHTLCLPAKHGRAKPRIHSKQDPDQNVSRNDGGQGEGNTGCQGDVGAELAEGEHQHISSRKEDNSR